MTNKEKYGNETLNTAIAAYNNDCNLLGDDAPAFWDWMDCTAHSADAIVCRGSFYTPAEIEQKIAEMEARKVTGYLLEWKKESKDEWSGSEFDVLADSNLWDSRYDHPAYDDWAIHETQIGFFAALPNVWLMGSDDWAFRLGVTFDARYVEMYPQKSEGVWEGFSTNDTSSYWRVRKVTIDGTLSETAKAFFRRNPDVWMDYKAK